MKLNEVGKKIVYGWIGALSLILLFMPYENHLSNSAGSVIFNEGYHFFLDAPHASTVAFGTVFIEIFIVTLIASALVFMLGRDDG